MSTFRPEISRRPVRRFPLVKAGPASSASLAYFPPNGTPISFVGRVNIHDRDAALDAISSRLRDGRGFSFFTLNLDHLVKLKTDACFQRAYRDADFVSADGWPVARMLRSQGRAVQRTTGADLVEPVCALAVQERLPIYFMGPAPVPLLGALKVLRDRYPGLLIAGSESPTLEHESSDQTIADLADRINKSGARICFLSLGAPKQEVLAMALRRECPQVGFLCVGAALDFISGHATRAPRLVQRLGGEWLWRMMTDPVRLAPRYLKCLGLFFELARRH